MLFTGEEIDLIETPLPEAPKTDIEINEKYRKGEIRIVTEQARYPLNTISSMIESGDYKLNPEYQRRHRWSNERRSAFIESMIMNVPIPPIFLYEYEYSRYEVMDGLQRLTAISSFYENKFRLEGLKKWPELNGRLYSELPKLVKQGVDRRHISSIILLHETAKNSQEAEQLKQMVFDRINSGGEDLTPQEKRNANFDGPLNKLCLSLSENSFLCRTWEIPEPSESDDINSERFQNKLFRTMTDVELVLRFFAYRQRARLQNGSLENYLDFYLDRGNKFSQDVLAGLKDTFEKSIALAYGIFEEQAFFLYRKRKTGWSWFERPTTAVYDPMMYALSLNIINADRLISRRDEIQSKLPGFYQANYESFEGRNTNPTALEMRQNLFVSFFSEFV